ncbi:unnamed protein product, partial [marine sediment metagenome]
TVKQLYNHLHYHATNHHHTKKGWSGVAFKEVPSDNIIS